MSISGLFSGFSLAADGRDDGAFFFQFGKNFVDILAVKAGDFCNLAGVHGCAEFAHGFQYLGLVETIIAAICLKQSEWCQSPKPEGTPLRPG